jgi:hypothetical protein
MLHVVVLHWKSDADPRDIELFLADADRLVREGPFRSVIGGAGLAHIAGSGDWGFAGELDSPERLDEWLTCPPHDELTALMASVLGRITSIQLAN